MFTLHVDKDSLAVKASEACVKLVKGSEGLRLQAYQDQVGKWTIGWGHLIKLPLEEYLLTNPISRDTAERILRLDLTDCEIAVNFLVKVPLNQNQFDALCDFVFNLGTGALERSTLLKKLNAGDYIGASEEFPKWCKAGGKVLRGLVWRRETERFLFLKEPI